MMNRFSECILTAALGLLLWLIAAVAVAEPRTALVIGNGAYRDAPLRNPANDARDMAAKLRELGFQVIERTERCFRALSHRNNDLLVGNRRAVAGGKNAG